MAARRLTSGQVAGKVCVGVVTGVRGLAGEVRVKSFTADPLDLGAYGPVSDETGGRVFKLRVTGTAKDQVLVRIDGIADRDAAEALKGVQFYVAREALPEADEDEYYHADLIGLTVERAGAAQNEEPLGRVKAVHDFGAGDVIEVEAPDGTTVLVPFTRRVVPEVDLAAGRLVVDPPDGVFDGMPETDRQDLNADDLGAETDEEDGTKG